MEISGSWPLLFVKETGMMGEKMRWLESKMKLYNIFSIIGGRICFLLPSRVGGLYHKSPVLRSRSPMRLTSGVPSSCHRNWGIQAYITYKIIIFAVLHFPFLIKTFVHYISLQQHETWTFQSSKTKRISEFCPAPRASLHRLFFGAPWWRIWLTQATAR